jgi:hypothetical protein
VVTLVEPGKPVVEGIERVEGAQADAGLAESIEEFRVRRHGADGVVQHVYFHAARGGRGQQSAQRAIAFLGLFEDEALHQHVVARPFDGANIAR